MTPLASVTAIGAALVAGIFYAFSTFLMQALGRLAPREGIAAMQSINVVVINPLFFVAFFGTGGFCVATVAASFFAEAEISLFPVLVGAVLYLAGCIGVTIVGNVPLNERLAKTNPDDSDAATLWSFYLARWTLWNHVRTAASLAASACFVLAIATG
ncbi:MAG: anthrone oxygenase family protein [Thermoanaerobaculales bacterium]|jgi:uncharacterized membrane protein|nr:anthrone oxygenase family protein [Thermoanaerobaculales bacterium]